MEIVLNLKKIADSLLIENENENKINENINIIIKINK